MRILNLLAELRCVNVAGTLRLAENAVAIWEGSALYL